MKPWNESHAHSGKLIGSIERRLFSGRAVVGGARPTLGLRSDRRRERAEAANGCRAGTTALSCFQSEQARAGNPESASPALPSTLLRETRSRWWMQDYKLELEADPREETLDAARALRPAADLSDHAISARGWSAIAMSGVRFSDFLRGRRRTPPQNTSASRAPTTTTSSTWRPHSIRRRAHLRFADQILPRIGFPMKLACRPSSLQEPKHIMSSSSAMNIRRLLETRATMVQCS